MREFASAALLVLSSTGLSAGAVSAQDGARDTLQTEDNHPEILVTAPDEEAPITTRERRAEIRQMATDIINVPRAGRTIATYFDAICPRVIGLPEAETRVIEERIALNAQMLGANRRNARKNCNPNITVIFVSAAKGPPNAWMTDDNDMIRHLLSYQRNQVLNESDPVRAWTVSTLRTADGVPLPNASHQNIGGGLDFSNPVRLASRLRTKSTVEITSSVVMIELAAANGKTLGQLADYASMRTFGNTRGLEKGATPAAATILTLFRDEDAPEQLTTFDRALISKMYDTSRNALARRYYSGIATRALEMEEQEAAQRP